MRLARHDVLFQPLQVGAKTFRNRFYSVPHASFPVGRRLSDVAFRRTKAEGGWAAVCGGVISLRSDSWGGFVPRIWHDDDRAVLARVATEVRSPGALAGIELGHGGGRGGGEKFTPGLGVSQVLDPTTTRFVHKEMPASATCGGSATASPRERWGWWSPTGTAWGARSRATPRPCPPHPAWSVTPTPPQRRSAEQRRARMPTAMTTRSLDDETIDRFRRDGFVVIAGLLDQDELDRYGAAVTDGVRARTADDGRPLAERSRYQQSFLQCMNLWEDCPDVRPLTFHPRLGQAAAELLGVDAIRLWHDQALYKEPGGRGTDAHQDHPYWPIKETASVTAWIPFDGSRRGAGAMAYLPGSHLIGLRKFVNIFEGDPEDILADPQVSAIEPVLVEVPKGSAAFHHGLTVHLAEANSLDRPRAVHTIIYFPDGSTRGYPNVHFAVDRGNIQVGQRIDSDTTPIVWPREPGDLPPVPSAPITLRGEFTNPGAIPTK